MLVLELLNNIGGAVIKPDHCVVESFACSLVPSYGRFTLVRNSNGFHIRAPIFVIEKLSAVSFEKFILTLNDISIDYIRIMFTPSRMMRDLLMRSRGRIHDLEVLVDE